MHGTYHQICAVLAITRKRGTMDDKFTDKLLKIVLIGALILAGIEALTLLLFPIVLFIKVMMK